MSQHGGLLNKFKGKYPEISGRGLTFELTHKWSYFCLQMRFNVANIIQLIVKHTTVIRQQKLKFVKEATKSVKFH